MADELVDPNLEAWIIGALLDASGPVLRSTPGILIDTHALKAEDFGTARCKTVFDSIQQLIRHRRPVDAQTVHTLAQGDFGQLESLQAQNQVDAVTLATHVQELQGLRVKRHLRQSARELLQQCTRKTPTKTILGLAQQLPRSVSLPMVDEWGSDDATRIMRAWELASEDPDAVDPICATGIGVVDNIVAGYVNNLNLIAGQESVGKSAYAAASILANLEAGHVVGVFGLEDATEWITKRHLAARLKIPAYQIGRPTDEATLLKAHHHLGEISQLTRRMLVHREGGINAPELVEKAKRWILAHRCRVIFIDHGGEITHRTDGDDFNARHDLAVKATYQQLRDLAVDYNVAIVVLCHFSSNADKADGPPDTGMIAESRYIGRMARLALGLWRKDGELRCTVMKWTDGQRIVHGQPITVALDMEEGGAVVARNFGQLIDLAAERAARAKKGKKAWGAEKEAEPEKPRKPHQASLLDPPADE